MGHTFTLAGDGGAFRLDRFCVRAAALQVFFKADMVDEQKIIERVCLREKIVLFFSDYCTNALVW